MGCRACRDSRNLARLGRLAHAVDHPGVGCPSRGAAGHTRAPPVSTRTAANAWALFSHHVVRPGTQQRLHVEQADLAVREGDFEQVSVVGAHRHDIGDKGLGTRAHCGQHRVRRAGQPRPLPRVFISPAPAAAMVSTRSWNDPASTGACSPPGVEPASSCRGGQGREPGCWEATLAALDHDRVTRRDPGDVPGGDAVYGLPGSETPKTGRFLRRRPPCRSSFPHRSGTRLVALGYHFPSPLAVGLFAEDAVLAERQPCHWSTQGEPSW